jgi:hypothetical protein
MRVDIGSVLASLARVFLDEYDRVAHYRFPSTDWTDMLASFRFHVDRGVRKTKQPSQVGPDGSLMGR